MTTIRDAAHAPAESRARPPGLLVRQIAPALAAIAFFAYVYFDNRDLPRNAGQFPAAMALIGLVLCSLYLLTVFISGLARFREGDGGLEGLPPALSREEFVRTLRTYVWLGLLVVAIWAFNFHIGVPLYLCAYLYRYAGVRRWWVFVVVALVCVLGITLVYGEIVRSTWSISLVERLFDFDMQRELRRFMGA